MRTMNFEFDLALIAILNYFKQKSYYVRLVKLKTLFCSLLKTSLSLSIRDILQQIIIPLISTSLYKINVSRQLIEIIVFYFMYIISFKYKVMNSNIPLDNSVFEIRFVSKCI